MLTKTQKASLLGISANYLSLIYHGKRRPGIKLAQDWERLTGKGYDWWQSAKLSQIQKTLDAVTPVQNPEKAERN
jgi:transcriptional regulator with XRE-family HTH domain